MKKLLCLLLSLLLLTTALAACGNDQEPQEPAEGTTAPTVTVTPDMSDPTDSQWEGDPTDTTGGVLETLEIGYDVVLEATRGLNTKDKDYGQTCLKDATVKLNKYGNHAYSTAAFKGDISVQDFYNLPVTTDYTTHVYTMKATVQLEETAYYTNIMLTDGSTSVRLYCSSANQYSWLKAYAGQQVTLEIAPCNWNSKSYYTGCVLAVVNSNGSKVYNTLNFN